VGAPDVATPDNRSFCSTLSPIAGEPLAGTAPTRRTWLLVEHPGPWGREPMADAPWPDGLGAALAQATVATGVRMLAVRRHDARPIGGPPAQPFVALALAGPQGWAVSRRLESPQQLRDLPLAELAAGRRPAAGSGWADAGPLWGVCTQGTRDACCARLGRRIAEDLTALDPEHTWEISHSGGHRFAPVLLAWPEGLTYGRVPAERLGELVDARRQGRVVPDLLRGRVHQPEPEQAAELKLRSVLGLAALDAVRPAAPPTAPGDDAVGSGDGAAGDGIGADAGNGRLPTWWQAGGRTWRVDVRRVGLPDRPASCGKAPEPASAWICDDPVPVA
jgi:(2Fe-2S) ferredoxin